MTAVKPSVWMFADERVEQRVASQRFIVGCIVCDKERWLNLHPEAARIGAARRRRRLAGISELLAKLQGFALLAYADLPSALVRPDEIDATDDIPRMKRRDNVWSQTVLAATAGVLACLRTGGVKCAEIDLYYDPKPLALAHKAAYEETLRQTLASIGQEDPETGVVRASAPFSFRRIEQVAKRYREFEASPVQRGTALAHHLCAQARPLIAGQKQPRVVVRNDTDAVNRMVSKFTSGSRVAG